MSRVTRRRFVAWTAAAPLVWAAAAKLARAEGESSLARKDHRASLARAGRASSNDKIVLGFVGVGGRGTQHVATFAARPDVEIAYLCDADQSRTKAAASAARGRAPKVVEDMRRILDDKSVDAVVIATPDHWHALATVWACQAGKDVYVEKPVANSVWEGRKMVEAARKYNRVVQAGTQNRSAAYNLKAKEYIDSGKLGRIEFVRIFNQKPTRNFPWAATAPAPAGLNWDLWNGPAPDQPYNATMHRTWHGFWRYGGGELTNDGVHQLDLARWVLGLKYPKTIHAVGRPFSEKGASEVPDTMIVTFEFPQLVMTLEQTLYAPYMLKESAAIRDGDVFPYWWQNATRIEIYGSSALMVLGRHGGGWQVFGRPQGNAPVVVDQLKGRFPDREHHANFLASIRTRSRPSADIEEGHISSSLCHMANISYRAGNERLVLDAEREAFRDHDRANQLLGSRQRAPYRIPDVV